ncbi:MAG: SHOCT domain-containing protein [Bacteroidetes bacterium]|nr:SHOCT domain-containing protein [Bacteroidota bacterium]
MKKYFFFLFSFCFWQVTITQTDSIVTKLQLYKDLYSKGLIDTQEYVALKAKLLGLNQPNLAEQNTWVDKSKTVDTEIFYDETLTDKILPNGLYMNLDEIKSKHPSLKCNLNVKVRSTYDYENGVGGNVMFKPTDDCISKDALKMDAWIYSVGARCYVNLERLKLQSFYNPVITMGRFLAFYKNQITNGVQIAGAWGE